MSQRESSPATARQRAWRLLSLLSPPLLLMAAIFYLSAQPNLVPTQGFWETLARKCFHAGEYLLLALGWWRALHGLLRRWPRLVQLSTAIAITLAFAASDEYHQSFVSGRHGSPRDVAIDSIGMAIAAAWVWLYARRTLGPSRPRAA